MFLAELGLSQWRSREFWLMMLMLIFTWFLRMVMHYCAQWIYVQAIGIPINMFNFEPHTVTLNYQPSLLETFEECLVVFFGPFFNSCVFSLFMFISWVSQKLVGSFPDIGSKFILAFGAMTFLDPIWILIVDAILGVTNPSTRFPVFADCPKRFVLFVSASGGSWWCHPNRGRVQTLLAFLSR